MIKLHVRSLVNIMLLFIVQVKRSLKSTNKIFHYTNTINNEIDSERFAVRVHVVMTIELQTLKT